MPRSKKIKHQDDSGKAICGAKLKSRGRKGSGKLCKRSPMANGKCALHGGKSTGPKNSAAYYKKQVLEVPGGTRLEDALGLANPLDLTGELGFVRSLLVQMQDDPLKAYCTTCKQWVVVDISCPHEEEMNENRINDGKAPQDHYVHVRDNDFSKVVTATKHLSEIAKNQKEIQKGKEITVRVEILNLLVAKVIEAYEEADKLGDSNRRRVVFVERLEQLVLNQSTSGVIERESRAATNG